jgi:hypothetical protein
VNFKIDFNNHFNIHLAAELNASGSSATDRLHTTLKDRSSPFPPMSLNITNRHRWMFQRVAESFGLEMSDVEKQARPCT